MTISASSSLTRGGSGAMFDRIARRYDLLNRINSFGLDNGWRQVAVEALRLAPGSRVIDLATGTADVALEVLHQEREARVVGVDPSPAMLEIGRAKIAAAGLDDKIELRLGEACELPFDDNEADGLAVAFGIRNVPDRERAIAEMARVVRPDGRIVILELNEPRSGLLAPFARFHIHRVVPRVGAWLSGSKEYRYLEKSIAAFPPPALFAEMLRANGCDVILIRPLAFGACSLYVARPSKARPKKEVRS